VRPAALARDHAQVSWYADHVVPRLVEAMCVNDRMLPLRQRAVSRASGTVLELGFGSGGNLPAYPDAVSKVIAVDPSFTGRRLAQDRIAAASVEVEFVGLDGQDLPLDDASVDTAVSTWTLCTIPDAVRAVSEVRRVLRPGGNLLFLEHGLSPDARTARWQHRLDGLQQRVAGGCHLVRDIRQVIEGGGLSIERCDNFTIAGPKPWTYIYAGVASAP
jgi:ubiquinone/menaquinone biosynthesis C-methylase UbiE